MNQSDSTPDVAKVDGTATGGHDAPDGAGPIAASQARPGRLLAMALGAGMLAGLVSWLLGEVVLDYFRPPSRIVTTMGIKMDVPSRAGEHGAITRNVALAFGLLGATLGLALGLAGGLARGSLPDASKGALVGLATGAVAGAATTPALLPIYFRTISEDPLATGLTIPLLVHGGIWTAVGAAGGLAFGIGFGAGRAQLIKIIMGGLVGGLVGTVAYELIGAFAFPMAYTPRPISETWGTRLIARLAVTIFAAAGVARGAAESHPRVIANQRPE